MYKGREGSAEILKRSAKKYSTKMLFCGHGSKISHPIPKQNISCHMFSAYTLKGKKKVPADLLRLNTLRDTKTVFSTPNRYDKHPRPSYMGVPAGGQLCSRPATSLSPIPVRLHVPLLKTGVYLNRSEI